MICSLIAGLCLTNHNFQALSSLVNLRNLNLQGNPIADKENLLKKVSLFCCNEVYIHTYTIQGYQTFDIQTMPYQVKKLLPNLHIFNARPIDKIATKEVHGKTDDFSVEAGN